MIYTGRDMDETQRQFILDAREIVEKIDRDLDELRIERFRGRKRRELAARIFRHVHTLKGSAASLGLDAVRDVAHEFESVLDGARLGRVTIDETLLNLFENASNLMAKLLSAAPTPADGNAKTLIARLQAIASAGASQGRIAGTLRAALPPDLARSLSEYDLQHAREAVREGARLFIVSASFPIEEFDRNFRELSTLLGQIGEVIATVPGEIVAADKIGFRLLYAAEMISDEIGRRAARLGRIEINELAIESSGTQQKDSLPEEFLRIKSEPPLASVRVDVSQLDQIINDAGELFRDTTRTLSATRAGTPQDVSSAIAHLQRRFGELEERLIKLRLVPLAEIMERVASRAGRIAARQLGKEVEFEIAAGDIEIDKLLADKIADPLLHLVRNGVTHGIESPPERVATGKRPVGLIKMAAFRAGGRIHIAVSDDGCGIDLEGITAVARQQGITGDDMLTMDQCLRLIFRPGFSTAKEVSDLSGRGIGLDVVDRILEQAGGEVRVHTEPGRGTTFLISLPVPLALVRCLMVRAAEQVYAIESRHILARLPLTTDEPDNENDADTIEWNGEPLRLYSLPRLLNTTLELKRQHRAAIIFETQARPIDGSQATKKIALGVSGIEGENESLVRSLGRHSRRWLGISGGAELPDGRVALVLDIEELIQSQE